MTKETIKQAADQFFYSEDVQSILGDLKFGNRYEASVSIFNQRNLGINLDDEVIRELIDCLNNEHAEYIFNLGLGLGSPELYIADRKLKTQNEKTHAIKTMQDMADELSKSGIQTDLLCHVNPDMLISDDVFENDLAVYKKMFGNYMHQKTDIPTK